MDDFKEEEEAKKLPCDHHYHKDCIDTWLKMVCICFYDTRFYIDKSTQMLNHALSTQLRFLQCSNKMKKYLNMKNGH